MPYVRKRSRLAKFIKRDIRTGSLRRLHYVGANVFYFGEDTSFFSRKLNRH